MITNELYSNEPNLIVYPITVMGVSAAADSFTAVLKVANEEDELESVAGVPLSPDERDVGEWEIKVNNALLAGKRFAQIEIEYVIDDYGTVNDKLLFQVTKRLIRYGDAKAAVDFDLSWEVFNATEKDVRFAIESYCAQKFDSWTGTRLVKTTGSEIGLPQHLEAMSNVYGGRVAPVLARTYAQTISEGYYVSENGYSILNVKPLKVGFYLVTGTWGFTSVPSAVSQAAWALFKSKLCDDVEYRNRYIANIRNENIRIEFRDEAYSGDTTGNAHADDILLPYKIFVIGVV